MKDIFTIKNIQEILTPQEILSGNFGFEKEGLRINNTGKLSQTLHPKIYGDKLTNPYITTDFSESQVEIVTPTFNNTNKAYQCLSFLVDIVNTSIPPDEYIWNQSMPCILPNQYMIPIAEYKGKKGEQSRDYRINLAKRYGTLKQMISGIHYNYSHSNNTINKLHKNLAPEKSLKNFKNTLYLKIVRNYNRYKWLLIYLTGASIAAHQTFTKECLKIMTNTDNHNSKYSTTGVSYRNSQIGYKNLKKLYPRYDTVANFIEDVQSYIKEDIISEAKELYTQIRLKPPNTLEYLKSLKNDGIEYLEIRSIDINPFDKCGISKTDIEFVHLFLIYLLIKEETSYQNWQEEGLINEETISEYAFNEKTRLLKDGKKIKIHTWSQQIIEEINKMNQKLHLEKEDIIEKMKERIINPKKTHAGQLLEIIKHKGFIPSQVSIAIHNKETSLETLDIETIRNNPQLYEYYTKALPQKKTLI